MLKEQKQVAAKNTINTDDAPDELLDPVTCALMEDPVELPESHYVVDRLTISKYNTFTFCYWCLLTICSLYIIEKHLMNDPHDPFTRAPLALKDVIERPDIKDQIDEYKAMKMSMMWDAAICQKWGNQWEK